MFATRSNLIHPPALLRNTCAMVLAALLTLSAAAASGGSSETLRSHAERGTSK